MFDVETSEPLLEADAYELPTSVEIGSLMRTIVSRFFRSPLCSSCWSAAKASAELLAIVNVDVSEQNKAGA